MLRAFTGILLSIGLVTSAYADDALPEPIRKPWPDYPAACMPVSDAAPVSERVTVMYDISRGGLPENVRVRESTNDCFNDTSIAAVRGWVFKPLSIKRGRHPDVETVFTFKMGEGTSEESYDARPLKRYPPRYPSGCMNTAFPRETVVVQFDVLKNGTTENIEVVRTTNNCLNRAAARSVKKWRYLPKKIDGEPQRRNGVQTEISFELVGGTFPEHKMRHRVQLELTELQNKIRRGESNTEAIFSEIAELEKEYGDSFRRRELGFFHYVRGLANIKSNNYAPALDDIRIAKKNLALPRKEFAVLEKLILQLETAVAEERLAEQESSEEVMSPSEEEALSTD